MIKYLWRLYIVLKPQAIIHHLRRIRSYPLEGKQRLVTIFVDMQELEMLCNVKILPPEALAGDAIRPLNPQELELDLKESGKFNRRTTQAIREELYRQNRLAAQAATRRDFSPDLADKKTLSAAPLTPIAFKPPSFLKSVNGVEIIGKINIGPYCPDQKEFTGAKR